MQARKSISGGRGTPITPLERTAADLSSRSKYPLASARASSMSASVARPALSTIPINTTMGGQLKLFTAEDDSDDKEDNDGEEDEEEKVLSKSKKPIFRTNTNLAMHRTSLSINLPKKGPSISTLSTKSQVPIAPATMLKHQVANVNKSAPVVPKSVEFLKPVIASESLKASLVDSKKLFKRVKFSYAFSSISFSEYFPSLIAGIITFFKHVNSESK